MPGRSTRVERKRHDYRPDDASDVRVLLVGESPPNGPTFFYSGNSGLFYATQEAFENAIPALRREPDFRDAFRLQLRSPPARRGGSRSSS